jgi:CRISPR-associated RAMP protein (TIGR02581 family)
MTESIQRGIQRRYLFLGTLTLETALHIGGGDALLGTTNSPIVRTADGKPFIPGSSLKGAFRSTVEKLAATIGLPHMEHDVIDPENPLAKQLNLKREQPKWTEADTLQHLEKHWPKTALLFGNPYTASKIFFADAYVPDDIVDVPVQRRDGVAIDRDSERVKEGLLYNYEVVDSTAQFGFEMTLENPTDTDLGLACLGLSEMLGGFFALGGKRSSGMGRCLLHNFQVYMLDLTTTDTTQRIKRLRRYLRSGERTEKLEQHADPQAFVETCVTQLLKEVGNAETAGE